MNKDTVVASVIGFGLGLVAAIALWVVPRVLPKHAPAPQTANTTQEENVAGKTDEEFTITAPQDGEITNAKTIKIEGQTAAAALVIVSTASSSAAISPTSDGTFSASLDLSEGSNEVAVTSLVAGEEKTKNITVYYLTDGI